MKKKQVAKYGKGWHGSYTTLGKAIGHNSSKKGGAAEKRPYRLRLGCLALPPRVVAMESEALQLFTNMREKFG